MWTGAEWESGVGIDLDAPLCVGVSTGDDTLAKPSAPTICLGTSILTRTLTLRPWETLGEK